MTINTDLPREVRAKKERIIALFFGAICSVVPGAAVCAILTFGLQNGLPVTERCNCSWEKVIVFSIAAFMISFLQTIGYWIYDKKYLNTMMGGAGHILDEWYSGKQKKLLFGFTLLFSIVPAVISFLGLPLIFDQNANFLWFFESAMGIICVLISVVMSIVIGIIQKLRYTQQCVVG